MNTKSKKRLLNFKLNRNKSGNKKMQASKPGVSGGIVRTTAYLLEKIDEKFINPPSSTPKIEEIQEPEMETTDETSSETLVEKVFENVDVNVMSSKSGTSEGLLNVGKTHYAETNLAEAKLDVTEDLGMSASVLSASAHMEYGLHNSVGVNASLVRAEANLGPLKMGYYHKIET
jgi:hypothetical protein